MRNFLFGLATAYAAFGLFFGVAMQRRIPAVNVAGVVYYAAVWPGMFAAGGFGTPSPPIPSWAFTFKDPR